MTKCELCGDKAKRLRLCPSCWEMIGRVQEAQNRIMFELLQKSLKALAKTA